MPHLEVVAVPDGGLEEDADGEREAVVGGAELGEVVDEGEPTRPPSGWLPGLFLSVAFLELVAENSSSSSSDSYRDSYPDRL